MNEKHEAAMEENEIPVEEACSQFCGTAKDVMESYSHCALCGANLHFIHVTNFVHNLTQETAKCPECGVKIRQITHRLH